MLLRLNTTSFRYRQTSLLPHHHPHPQPPPLLQARQLLPLPATQLTLLPALQAVQLYQLMCHNPLSVLSLKLPPFWPSDPQLWFAQVESQFTTRGISEEHTKFSYVVSSLAHDYAHEVRDILLSPPRDQPYATLKTQLVARLCSSEQKRIRQLLTEEQLGDRKPSQFL